MAKTVRLRPPSLSDPLQTAGSARRRAWPSATLPSSSSSCVIVVWRGNLTVISPSPPATMPIGVCSTAAALMYVCQRANAVLRTIGRRCGLRWRDWQCRLDQCSDLFSRKRGQRQDPGASSVPASPSDGAVLHPATLHLLRRARAAHGRQGRQLVARPCLVRAAGLHASRRRQPRNVRLRLAGRRRCGVIG